MSYLGQTNPMTAAESPTFHSGSLVVTAGFTEPAFELAHAGPTLQRHIFQALRDHEIDLPGLQETVMPSGPGNWNLAVNFLGFRASLKLQVGTIQVTFVNEVLREGALIKQVLQGIEQVILRAVPSVSVAQRELVQQIHCRLSARGIRERIPPCSGSVPEELGILAGQGIGLYFTSSLFSGEAGVVLDKSAVLDEGLFVQVRCRFDAESFDLNTSCDNFQRYLTALDGAFRLNGTLRSST